MPLEGFSRSFTAYALLGESLSSADIDFDCYEPQIANELFTVVEAHINLNYRAEPPLCGSCQEEAGLGTDESPSAS